jgi:peptidoglycan-associated lipoprotein
MKHVLKVVLATAVIALAACKGGGETVPDSVDNGGVGANDGALTSGNNNGPGITVTPEQARINDILRNNLVVYFDYDQADLRPEFNEMLQVHGRNLSRNPNMQVRLEGHADERGSREYNIGLGERRAQAVRRVLMLQGATAQQLSTVSYGEERPAQTGSDEEAWRLNRRVELVYR